MHPAMTKSVAQVAKRMLSRVPDLVERLGEIYITEVPEYAALGPELVRRDVLPVSRTLLEHFFTALAAGRTPAIENVREAVEMGRRRMEMGVPLEAMLHVYRIGGRAVFRAVMDSLEPGEEAALGEIGLEWLDYVDHASSAGAAAYLKASHDRIREVEATRGALIQALLSARNASDVAVVAAEFSVILAPVYVPVVVGGEGAAAQVEPLLRESPAGSLAGIRGRILILLVPGDSPDLDRVRTLPPESTVVSGRAGRVGPDLQAQVEHAERVLWLASTKGLQGAFTTDDLMLEQLANADVHNTGRLREIVAVLTEHDKGGLIMATIRTYLETGSVAATAKQEYVHPNTVTYRLHRVKELTGFDPRLPADAAVLVLALAASP